MTQRDEITTRDIKDSTAALGQGSSAFNLQQNFDNTNQNLASLNSFVQRLEYKIAALERQVDGLAVMIGTFRDKLDDFDRNRLEDRITLIAVFSGIIILNIICNITGGLIVYFALRA